MVKKILIGILSLIVLLVIVIAIQPARFRITRSATISAPADQVFAQINDLHQWNGWSPWAKLDPNMKTTFEGPSSGEGASYVWSGNDDVGEGKMTITESRPSELVRIDLEFIRPFAAKNDTEFVLAPEGDQTKVTWSMSGTNGFMAKAFSLLMNMDKMVGADFEKGLAAMKTIVEGGSAAPGGETPTAIQK